jgi:hypothetical protein
MVKSPIYLSRSTRRRSYISRPNNRRIFSHIAAISHSLMPFNLHRDQQRQISSCRMNIRTLYRANRSNVSRTVRSSSNQSNCGQKPISTFCFCSIGYICQAIVHNIRSHPYPHIIDVSSMNEDLSGRCSFVVDQHAERCCFPSSVRS